MRKNRINSVPYIKTERARKAEDESKNKMFVIYIDKVERKYIVYHCWIESTRRVSLKPKNM